MEEDGEAVALPPLDGLRGRSMLWMARSCCRGFSRYTDEQDVFREGLAALKVSDVCRSEVALSYID